MKKIMISLLMVAATMSAMAATVAGQASITLKADNGKSCKLTLAELSDGVAGLNPGYYAELNEEGKEVCFYVEFGGKKYQTFGSNAATMENLQLGIKTNASTSYTLTASGIKGSKVFKLKINGVEYTVDASLNDTPITLAASATLPAAGDEDKYKVNPKTAGVSICFNYNVLEINGHAGEALKIAQGATVIDQQTSIGATYSKDLSSYTGRIVVTLGTKEYQIDANPSVTVKP
jgi:hypothetical protein